MKVFFRWIDQWMNWLDSDSDSMWNTEWIYDSKNYHVILKCIRRFNKMNECQTQQTVQASVPKQSVCIRVFYYSQTLYIQWLAKLLWTNKKTKILCKICVNSNRKVYFLAELNRSRKNTPFLPLCWYIEWIYLKKWLKNSQFSKKKFVWKSLHLLTFLQYIYNFCGWNSRKNH